MHPSKVIDILQTEGFRYAIDHDLDVDQLLVAIETLETHWINGDMGGFSRAMDFLIDNEIREQFPEIFK